MENKKPMTILPQLEKAVSAARALALIPPEKIEELLLALSDETIREIPFILTENQKDLERMDPADPVYDRLQLTEERISSIAQDIRNVAVLPSPLGKILEEKERPNGLLIKKVIVPFGIIGIIYEARPNVTFDVFSFVSNRGIAVS